MLIEMKDGHFYHLGEGELDKATYEELEEANQRSKYY